LFHERSAQSFAAWLESIAECQAYNVISASKRQKRGGNRTVTRIATQSSHSSWNGLVESLMDASGTGREKLGRQEAVRAIQVAVAGLPEDERTAVQLHHLDGQNIESTAAIMARSPGAVRGLLQRARQAMRAGLGRSSRWFAKKT